MAHGNRLLNAWQKYRSSRSWSSMLFGKNAWRKTADELGYEYAAALYLKGDTRIQRLLSIFTEPYTW
jgi:hypothetical protein